MENRKIRIFHKGEYIDRDINSVINYLYNNNWHFNDRKTLSIYLSPFQLNKDDEEYLINQLKYRLRDDTNFLIQYQDKHNKEYDLLLKNYLFKQSFHLFNENEKINILKLLNIPPYKYQEILQYFSLKN